MKECTLVNNLAIRIRSVGRGVQVYMFALNEALKWCNGSPVPFSGTGTYSEPQNPTVFDMISLGTYFNWNNTPLIRSVHFLILVGHFIIGTPRQHGICSPSGISTPSCGRLISCSFIRRIGLPENQTHRPLSIVTEVKTGDIVFWPLLGLWASGGVQTFLILNKIYFRISNEDSEWPSSAKPVFRPEDIL